VKSVAKKSKPGPCDKPGGKTEGVKIVVKIVFHRGGQAGIGKTRTG